MDDIRSSLSPERVRANSREADRFGRYEGLFSKFGIRCAVVANQSVVARQLAKNPDMEVRFEDEQWRVFASRR